MNARLSRDMEAEDFVTVILAEFGPGEVRIVNCGHHPPVKLAAGAGGLQVMAPEEFAPPLGLNPHPARQDIGLKPGDRLLFYTDGLVESRDRAGRFFGLDDRVAAALALPDLGPRSSAWSGSCSSTPAAAWPTTSCSSWASPFAGICQMALVWQRPVVRKRKDNHPASRY
jgi:Stage II sporulation protein E (SpoIIE)